MWVWERTVVANTRKERRDLAFLGEQQSQATNDPEFQN